MNQPTSDFFEKHPTSYDRAIQYDCIVDSMEAYMKTSAWANKTAIAKTCFLAELHNLKSLVEITKLGIGQ